MDWATVFNWIVDSYEGGNSAAAARKIGVSKTGIHKICNGKSVPSGDTLRATLRAYPKLSAEWLLRWEGEPEARSYPESDAAVRLEEIRSILDRPPGRRRRRTRG